MNCGVVRVNIQRTLVEVTRDEQSRGNYTINIRIGAVEARFRVKQVIRFKKSNRPVEVFSRIRKIR